MRGELRFIYVAGCYSASNIIDVFRNIRRGLTVTFSLLKAGYIPFVPWFDWLWLFIDEDEAMEVQDFQRYSIEWMRKCDAVYVHEYQLKPWNTSKGTVGEVELARKLTMPVYLCRKKMDAERGW